MIKLQKTAWVSYALSILILACMNACENPLEKLNPELNQGILNIEIGLEMKIFKSKARLQAVNTDDFLVVIKKANDEVYLSYNRAADVPSNISVNPGDYYIEVESPNDMSPAFDNPKYYGKSDLFSIHLQQKLQFGTLVVGCHKSEGVYANICICWAEVGEEGVTVLDITPVRAADLGERDAVAFGIPRVRGGRCSVFDGGAEAAQPLL